MNAAVAGWEAAAGVAGAAGGSGRFEVVIPVLVGVAVLMAVVAVGVMVFAAAVI